MDCDRGDGAYGNCSCVLVFDVVGMELRLGCCCSNQSADIRGRRVDEEVVYTATETVSDLDIMLFQAPGITA